MNRRTLVIGTAVVAALAAGAAATIPTTVTPSLRHRLAAALGARFDSTVDIAHLHVSVLPRLRVTGEGIVLRHKGTADGPPLITIQSFSAEANIWGITGRPLHFARVHAKGLEVNIPHGGFDIDDDDDLVTSTRGGSATVATDSADDRTPIVVDEVIADDAVLRILRGKPGKKPREFAIHHLAMKDVASNQPSAFKATLTNPTPPGEIEATGTFGPWNAEEPAATPLAADYEFTDAKLDVFDEIRGTLHSTGSFSGVLDDITVDGQAEIPDFALENAGHAVALSAKFHSLVNGTNGNTRWQPVRATFLNTTILANGGVVEEEGATKGRRVFLDAVIEHGRIEDVLRLAVKSKRPSMTGALKLKTKIVVPPGHVDVMQKLGLDGSFIIDQAKFTKSGLQAKINALSQKARGDHDGPPDTVASDFSGRFVMDGGVIRFSRVTFRVPGARLDLSGVYRASSETVDFSGDVKLDAKLSELTTGFKSVLLKPFDPILRHKDVTVIPITIRGDADHPEFKFDLKRAF